MALEIEDAGAGRVRLVGELDLFTHEQAAGRDVLERDSTLTVDLAASPR